MTSINQITVIPWLSAAIFLPSTNGVSVDPALGLMPKITLVIDYICHISGWNMISSSEKRWNMGNSVRSNNATTEFPASSSWSDVDVAKPNHQIRPIRSRFQYPHINSIFFLTYYLKVPTNHTLTGGCWTARRIRVPINI